MNQQTHLNRVLLTTIIAFMILFVTLGFTWYSNDLNVILVLVKILVFEILALFCLVSYLANTYNTMDIIIYFALHRKINKMVLQCLDPTIDTTDFKIILKINNPQTCQFYIFKNSHLLFVQHIRKSEIDGKICFNKVQNSLLQSDFISCYDFENYIRIYKWLSSEIHG